MDSFEPWLGRVERRGPRSYLARSPKRFRPSGTITNWTSWEQLLARLDQRRGRVRELIVQARDSGRQPFVHWK